jgi:hypothetical protein
MPSLIRGQFFYLYLFIDIFSQNIVGWQVYEEENSALAGELLRDLVIVKVYSYNSLRCILITAVQ